MQFPKISISSFKNINLKSKNAMVVYFAIFLAIVAFCVVYYQNIVSIAKSIIDEIKAFSFKNINLKSKNSMIVYFVILLVLIAFCVIYRQNIVSVVKAIFYKAKTSQSGNRISNYFTYVPGTQSN